MLINDSKKIIVLQNPKTGGQFKANQIVGGNSGFFRRHIEDYFSDDGEFHKVIFPFHITYKELREYLGKDFNDWKIYVIVRNPYNRVASALNFRRRNLAQQYDESDFSFENALSLVERHKEILLPNYDSIWFTAQSFWTGRGVEILRYESDKDWRFLDNMLCINDDKIHIKGDYELSEDIKSRIKNLYYPYDKEIFDIYNL